MKKILLTIILICLIAAAVFSRFYKLGTAPDSLIVDEAHYAYIAYSILETGKDEHGEAYPLAFKGFGDYKLPAQVYALVPVIKLFGLNNFATRLPAALSGILLVVTIYLLFLEWGFNKRSALFASLIVLISPWTFILSRFAFEASLGLLFFSLAILFIFKANRQNKLIFFILAALFFSLSIYSYVVYKFVAAFFVGFFAVYFLLFKKIPKKQVFLFVITFLILVSPFLLGKAANSNLARFKQVGVLNNVHLALGINENRDFCLKNCPKIICYSFFNKGFTYTKALANNFVKIYSIDYLFVKGDQGLPYINVEDTGLFNLFLLPLYLIGVIFFFTQLFSKKNKQRLLLVFIACGLLIAPLPGVLAGVQKIRISIGFFFILPLLVMAENFLSKKILKKYIFDFIIFVISLIAFAIYFINFTSVHAIKKDFYYDSFVKGIFAFTKDYLESNQVDEVIIQGFFSDPMMFYSYYQQVDPEYYQKNIVLSQQEASGFQHAIRLANYRVVQNEKPYSLACEAYQKNKQVIYVDNHWEKEDNEHVLKIIKSNFDVLDYAFIINLTAFGKELSDSGQCQ